MEFELEQNMIIGYEPVGQASICQEETLEAIVPDACPDIMRIAAVYAQSFPSRSEARDGQATVSGMIQASVLYLPETGGAMQTIPLRLPFSVRFDLPGLAAQDVLEISAKVCRADTRMLNPRKVLFRCDLMVEIAAVHKAEYAVCSGVMRADEKKLCQKQTDLEYEWITSVPQRIFPLSEEIHLTGAQPPVLLCARASTMCTESRIVGSKLIFKGKLDVEMLLQASDGDIERRCESIPFSQILDSKGAGEDCTAMVRLEVVEFSCVQPMDDPFHLMMEAEVLAMGQVREQGTVQILTDLYSTTHYLLPELQQLKLYAPCEQVAVPQTIRDLIETGDVVRTVCDSTFLPGRMHCSKEGTDLNITACGVVSVIYLDESRQVRCADKNIEFSARIPGKDTDLLHIILLPGELHTAPCVGGIEVRLNVEFQAVTARPVYVDSIKYVSMGEPRCADANRPSVILRQPEPGESLWDIAKACGTTCDQIIQANELAGEDLPSGKMLLIPGVR